MITHLTSYNVINFIQLLLELGTKTLVEVEIFLEDLVGILHRKKYLDPHDLDYARHEVHGRGGADGCDIVRLECLGDSLDGAVPPEGIYLRAMFCLDVVCNLLCRPTKEPRQPY